MLEAVIMVPSLCVAFYYGDGDAWALLKSIGVPLLVGFPLWRFSNPGNRNFRAREGLLVVAAGWLLLAAFGSLPFLFSGMIPHPIDAFFESVSGFTTTGSSILTAYAGQPRGIMFWRSFTHWIGGMGVLVLALALLPRITGRTSHLMRAESPGPSLSKFVPRMGDTAKILYLIYGVMTLILVVVLILTGLSPFDALIHAFGTAGTGGFSNYGASVGALQNPVAEAVIMVFMILFGTNFAVYYRMLAGGWKDAIRSEELRWYLSIVVASILLISLVILPHYGNNILSALRHGSFQVASIISTTGFATTDFNLWPLAAKFILFLLMFIGSCAGSTAGGLKVVRVAILSKMARREMRHAFQPRKMQVIRFEGRTVEEATLIQVAVFFFAYLALIILGVILVSLENHFDLESNLTAVVTCISNVGPGLGMVGPVENFAKYGYFSKFILTMMMLLGRLEIFPILALLHPSIWRKQ